jgi:hypothetical protein
VIAHRNPNELLPHSFRPYGHMAQLDCRAMDHLGYCASQPLSIFRIDFLVPCSVEIAPYGRWNPSRSGHINFKSSPFGLQLFVLVGSRQVQYNLEAYRWLVFGMESLVPFSVAVVLYGRWGDQIGHHLGPFWLRMICWCDTSAIS